MLDFIQINKNLKNKEKSSKKIVFKNKIVNEPPVTAKKKT